MEKGEDIGVFQREKVREERERGKPLIDLPPYLTEKILFNGGEATPPPSEVGYACRNLEESDTGDNQ